jgi:hypothetical protein
MADQIREIYMPTRPGTVKASSRHPTTDQM